MKVVVFGESGGAGGLLFFPASYRLTKLAFKMN